MLFCLIITIAVVIIDQLSKLAVVGFIPENGYVRCIDGVFHLTYIENDGAAFGMLSEHRWIFMAVSVIAIALIFLYIIREKPKSTWLKTALAFVAGGGIGNMIDRIFRGSVIDFIDIDFVNFYVFNAADAFVTVGCAIIIAYLLFVELPRDSADKKKKKKPLDAAEEEIRKDSADE